MNGKSKCRLLKQIRRQIAAENDIAFVTSECKYQGDCTGTCPKCEAELRYLEEQLRLRQKAGKAVAVAGIAATLMVTATGCDLMDILHPVTDGDPLPPSSYGEQLKGNVALPTDVPGGLPLETDPTEPEFMGVPMPPATNATDPTELMGEPLPESDQVPAPTE